MNPFTIVHMHIYILFHNVYYFYYNICACLFVCPVLSEQSAVVVHIGGLISQEGSLTCYLPVLVQGVLGDILEEGTVEPETEPETNTNTQADEESASGMRPGSAESEPPVTRKRTIREDE